jgi:hypothetical protein
MTEEEWLTSDDPVPLATYLRERGGRRKRCLLAAACCRRIWHLIRRQQLRDALELSERWADREVTEEAFGPFRDMRLLGGVDATEASVNNVCSWIRTAWSTPEQRFSLDLVHCVSNAVLAVGFDVAYRGGDAAWGEPRQRAMAQERRAQADLIRDVFGNPFRPACVEPEWLTFREGLVRTMARGIYEERKFEEMPILADALEDAGCTDEAILRHLRAPGFHARGCWCLDLLLNRT